MRIHHPAPTPAPSRRNRLLTLATWAPLLALGWGLVRLVLALVRDFWVIVILLCQP